MWESFVHGDNGVAVRTTVGALRGVLDAGSADRDVFLGRVEYMDYRAGSWGEFHWFAPAFHKRRIFRQEQDKGGRYESAAPMGPGPDAGPGAAAQPRWTALLALGNQPPS